MNIAIADATQTVHVPVSGVSEVGGFTELDGATGVAIYDISNRTYAVVTASIDDGVQIIDITQPDNPLPVATISDNIDGFTELDGATGVAIYDTSNGTYAVVTASIDDGVQIIDITQPDNPLPVAAITDGIGGFTELDGATGVAIHDISNRTYAVVTAAFDDPWQIINITQPDNPLPVPTSDYEGNFAELVWGMDLIIFNISGRTYAIGTDYKNDSVWIYDITQPNNYFLTATITDGIDGFTKLDGATGVAVHGISNRTYAVVAASVDDGVQIIDITQPDNPLPVAAVTDAANGFTKLNNAASIAVHDISNRTYAVVAAFSDYGVQIIDITQLGNPLPVAAITHDTDGFTELFWPNGVAVHDISGRTYAAVTSSIDYGVQIIDITQPDNPLPVAAITGDTKGFVDLDDTTDIVIHDIADKTYAVVTARYGVQIIDITQPDNPLPVTVITDNTESFTDLVRPHILAIHDTSNRTYAFVNAPFNGGVQIIDITQPDNPLPVSWLDNAFNIAIHDISGKTYAVLTSSSGVQIIDITRLDNPLPVAAISDGVGDILPPPSSLYGHRTHLPLNTTTAATNNPDDFTELSWPYGVAIYDASNGTYAVVTASEDSGVQIIDITQPDNPLPVAAITDGIGGYTNLAGAGDIAIHDILDRTYALVAAPDDDGVQIIDITQPDNPLPVAAVTDVNSGGRYNEWYTIVTHNPPCTALFLDSLEIRKGFTQSSYSADDIVNGTEMSMVMFAYKEDDIIHLVAERPEVSGVGLVIFSPLEVIPSPPPEWRTLAINPNVQKPIDGIPNKCYNGLDPALDRLVMESLHLYDRGILTDLPTSGDLGQPHVGLVDVLVHTHHSTEVQVYLGHNGVVASSYTAGREGSPGVIAANVPISLLGPLSERDEVLMVEMIQAITLNQ